MRPTRFFLLFNCQTPELCFCFKYLYIFNNNRVVFLWKQSYNDYVKKITIRKGDAKNEQILFTKRHLPWKRMP